MLTLPLLTTDSERQLCHYFVRDICSLLSATVIQPLLSQHNILLNAKEAAQHPIFRILSSPSKFVTFCDPFSYSFFFVFMVTLLTCFLVERTLSDDVFFYFLCLDALFVVYNIYKSIGSFFVLFF